MQAYDSGCCFRGASAPNRPRVLWELNTRCNLHCSWCHANPHMDDGLPTSEIVSGLQLIQKWGIRDVIFSGGEPLLRKDLTDLIQAAYSLGMDTDLCTNGTLVDMDHAKSLGRYLSEISVSIDAADPETYDRLRGTAGAFQKMIRGTEYLLQAGIEVHAITLCCDETVQGMEDTIRLLSEMGVNSVTLLGLIQIKGVHTPISFSPKARETLIHEIPRLRSNYPAITINTKRVCHTESPIFCSAGDRMYGIDARGGWLPCILLKGKSRSIPLKELEGLGSLKEAGERLRAQDKEPYWPKCSR